MAVWKARERKRESGIMACERTRMREWERKKMRSKQIKEFCASSLIEMLE